MADTPAAAVMQLCRLHRHPNSSRHQTAMAGCSDAQQSRTELVYSNRRQAWTNWHAGVGMRTAIDGSCGGVPLQVRQMEAEVVAMTAAMLNGGPGTSAPGACGAMTSGVPAGDTLTNQFTTSRCACLALSEPIEGS